ncbi:hypothetical protein GYMLUDRAFT_54371 [Collybiopsis luxurians FD-317 M1]|nr:hypothetical protein GYMLUDRAFT_54371 [Collybiopsis luxurians FD-317 M1]
MVGQLPAAYFCLSLITLDRQPTVEVDLASDEILENFVGEQYRQSPITDTSSNAKRKRAETDEEEDSELASPSKKARTIAGLPKFQDNFIGRQFKLTRSHSQRIGV